MVHYICFVMLTPQFLQLSLKERESFIPKWTEMAKKYGLVLLFGGNALGIAENVVLAFEAPGHSDNYFKFMRDWLELGTPNAGKLISYTRTVTIN
jgi:hypothetical protein